MPTISLAFWLIVFMWATTTVAFLSKLDKRKLAILVIFLSLLVLVALVWHVPVPATKPAVLPVSTSQTTTPT